MQNKTQTDNTVYCTDGLYEVEDFTQVSVDKTDDLHPFFQLQSLFGAEKLVDKCAEGQYCTHYQTFGEDWRRLNIGRSFALGICCNKPCNSQDA